MKRLSIILSVILIASSASFAQKKRNKRNQDEMLFAQEYHDYGTMEYGSNGTYKFSFKNTSKKPLVISNVKSSCNCTTPAWPKEPIQPGQSGSITVKYNTILPGMFNKTVQVFSSAKNSPVRLTIKGKILPKPGSNKVLKGDAPIRSDNKKNKLDNEDKLARKSGLNTKERKISEGSKMDMKARKKALYQKKMKDVKKKKK